MRHRDADGAARTYDFLFWEAATAAGFGAGGIAVHLPHAVCAPVATLGGGLLHDLLTAEGLNHVEATEMATHWLPALSVRAWVLLEFAPRGLLDERAPLAVAPAPPLLLRVLLLFKPVDAAPPGVRVAASTGAPPSVAKRPAYAVVEWGGMACGEVLDHPRDPWRDRDQAAVHAHSSGPLAQ